MNIQTINTILKKAGFKCYIVGGAVRNSVAGFTPKDYDLTTDARPSDVMSLFRRTVPTGIEHGTVSILMGKEQYEITTFRTESTYSDSRHPDSVRFADNIEEDLSRRDFSMNALAWDISSSKMIDRYHGVDAIRNGIIQAIGNPAERFREDALRILRAVRFVAQLGFTIETSTYLAASEAVQNITSISIERIRDELTKIIQGRYCADAFILLQKMNILKYVLPELEACVGVGQKGSHSFDVFLHSIYACEGASADNLIVRIAALLHDVGKVPCRKIDTEGNISFHHHENKGADIAEEMLQHLRFPRSVIKEVTHLIRQHMFHYTEDWTDAAVRRFIARTGENNLDNLFELRFADSYGMNREKVSAAAYNSFRKRIRQQIDQNHALTLKDLKVNGNQLAESGIPRSPVMGVIFGELLDTVLDDPLLNTREELTEIALNIYRRISSRQD